MTWRGLLVLVALVVACGGSTNGGTGGSGGLPDPAPKACVTDEDCEPGLRCASRNEIGSHCELLGALVECDTIFDCDPEVRPDECGSYIHNESTRIPTSPGEVLTVSHCNGYSFSMIKDGAELEPPTFGPDGRRDGCSTYEVVVERDDYRLVCLDHLEGTCFPDGVEEVCVSEHGWDEIYVRREGD